MRLLIYKQKMWEVDDTSFYVMNGCVNGNIINVHKGDTPICISKGGMSPHLVSTIGKMYTEIVDIYNNVSYIQDVYIANSQETRAILNNNKMGT